MNLADLHVMLVEDHGFQRRLGLRLLADLGVVHLHEAADGFQALTDWHTRRPPLAAS